MTASQNRMVCQTGAPSFFPVSVTGLSAVVVVAIHYSHHFHVTSLPTQASHRAGQPQGQGSAEQGSTKQGSAEQGSGKGWPYYIRMQARLLEPRPCRVGLPPEAFTSGRPRPPARGGP